MRIVITTALLILVAGCAPKSKFPQIDQGLAEAEARKQRAAVVDATIRDYGRLRNIAFRIAVGNADLCGEKVGRAFGIQTVTLDLFEGAWKAAWRSQLGVGDQPTIMVVVPDSPAERAGLRPGDRLLGIGGSAVGTGRNAMAAVRLPPRTGTMEFVVERDGFERRFAVTPVIACDYPTVLVRDDSVNAFADGKSQIFSTGMLRFAQQDEELALIVGHELAHNSRGHIAAKTANMALGGLLGTAISVLAGVDVTDQAMRAGAGAFSQEFEAEADYVGVYHAARAGYDVRKAASFWRRLAVAHPQGIHLAGATHPSTAKRFLAIEKAAEEVDRKRAGNAPLVPEER